MSKLYSFPNNDFDRLAKAEAIRQTSTPFFSYLSYLKPQAGEPIHWQAGDWTSEETMPPKRAIIQVKTTTVAEDLVYCPDSTYRSQTAAVAWARRNVSMMPAPPRPPTGSHYVIGIVRARDGGPAIGWQLQNQ